ncbi:MAG: hypothetical protein LBM02_09955 [Lachnospiraceae bacterium]|jgi:co-chaperonin GroES (HSP10)|nr:hypothetical protein [Lachnospiraceae bacterium]
MNTKPLNNKILFRLLPEEQQPKKTILVPDGDVLKKAEVIEVGEKVVNIQKGDEIVLYVNDIRGIGDGIGFCADSNPIFINERPQPNKTHISHVTLDDNLTKFNNGKVISTTDHNLNKEDIVGYVKGAGLILPDGTEIISDNQIFYNLVKVD